MGPKALLPVGVVFPPSHKSSLSCFSTKQLQRSADPTEHLKKEGRERKTPSLYGLGRQRPEGSGPCPHQSEQPASLLGPWQLPLLLSLLPLCILHQPSHSCQLFRVLESSVSRISWRTMGTKKGRAETLWTKATRGGYNTECKLAGRGVSPSLCSQDLAERGRVWGCSNSSFLLPCGFLLSHHQGTPGALGVQSFEVSLVGQGATGLCWVRGEPGHLCPEKLALLSRPLLHSGARCWWGRGQARLLDPGVRRTSQEANEQAAGAWLASSWKAEAALVGVEEGDQSQLPWQAGTGGAHKRSPLRINGK